MDKEANTLERDKQILDVVTKTFAFQFDLRERLDGKLNNFIAITSTVATLSLGLALFVFDRIPIGNLYFWHLVVSFGLYLFFFTAAIIVGLTGYRPTSFTWYPEDPVRLIKEYAELINESEVIHVVAASFAQAANMNKEGNAMKSRTCNCIYWLFILGILTIVVFAALMILALSAQTPNPSV